MSTHPCRRLLIVALLAPALAAQRAGAPELAFQPGSSLWIEGTSTMRNYRCSAAVVEGSVAAERAGSLADLAGGVGGVDVSVRVAGLDCRNQTMNSHMRNALEVERHPVIRFVAPSVAVASRGAEGTARVTGTLTIAGTERPLTLVAAVAEEANGGGVRVRGSTRLRMTEFGVRPPTLMLGTVRVHDPVTVHFDVVLKP